MISQFPQVYQPLVTVHPWVLLLTAHTVLEMSYTLIINLLFLPNLATLGFFYRYIKFLFPAANNLSAKLMRNCFNKTELFSFVHFLKKLFSINNCAMFFSSVRSLSRVQLFATPWTAARQASQSITDSQSWPKPTSTESMMPSNYLILSSLHEVAKVLEFQLHHQSFQWTPRTDLL